MEHEETEPPSTAAAQPSEGPAGPGLTDQGARTQGCGKSAAPPEPSLRSSPPSHADRATHAACLERLATALSGYDGLAVTVRADGAAPYLAARNTDAPAMSETVTIGYSARGLAYTWSWGKRITETSDPDTAAQAIAYVLGARGVHLGTAP